MGTRRSGENELADPVAGYRRRVVTAYFLRFHMGLILCAVSAAGVLSSRLLLLAGLDSVLVRYPLAAAGAYLTFFALVRLWIAYVQPSAPAGPGRDGRDCGFDLAPDGLSIPSASNDSVHFGGGDSGGGGASSSWASSPGGSGSSSGSSFDIDAGDGTWILIALAALVAVIFGSGLYLVWAAPQILPDAAVHAAVASGLVRATRRLEAQGWMTSLFRASVIPFLLVAAAAAALGYAVHSACPSAVKLADAFHCAR